MLLNYEPFTDAARLLDRVATQVGVPGGMPMDIQRLDDHFVAAFDLPGVDPGSIDVTVESNALTVRAERSTPHEGGEWLTRERPRGSFGRRLMLGRDLDTERLTATYRDGVLTITIPVTARAKPRRVEISHPHTGRTTLAADPAQDGIEQPELTSST
ncbi:Hsp20/alpha crystallin family protein [Pseudonocardia sp. WMMC193]|uniref:Hsp20/alpha crystallin family protein n=1 Tax=Pseudonocardia sp. WMMC193 TaxID=2911965 RepID=UPI001F399258|nr:HSP20 family small heat-shock protein [Pseudonocardia sp. WMMC193]MCF7547293.1 Hsp20 family protein [Pseudonocardia sp. WMMC193]MCF7547388.1 Hsp20 family protein [Pseudonocardia sp. WMMC193]